MTTMRWTLLVEWNMNADHATCFIDNGHVFSDASDAETEACIGNIYLRNVSRRE